MLLTSRDPKLEATLSRLPAAAIQLARLGTMASGDGEAAMLKRNLS